MRIGDAGDAGWGLVGDGRGGEGEAVMGDHSASLADVVSCPRGGNEPSECLVVFPSRPTPNHYLFCYYVPYGDL